MASAKLAIQLGRQISAPMMQGRKVRHQDHEGHKDHEGADDVVASGGSLERAFGAGVFVVLVFPYSAAAIRPPPSYLTASPYAATSQISSAICRGLSR